MDERLGAPVQRLPSILSASAGTRQPVVSRSFDLGASFERAGPTIASAVNEEPGQPAQVPARCTWMSSAVIETRNIRPPSASMRGARTSLQILMMLSRLPACTGRAL
jgi:hypothetical protein